MAGYFLKRQPRIKICIIIIIIIAKVCIKLAEKVICNRILMQIKRIYNICFNETIRKMIDTHYDLRLTPFKSSKEI